jgi:hypothetical protein
MNKLSPIDRMLRLILAAFLFELAFFWLSGQWAWVSASLGVVAAATSAFSFCPLYKLFNIRTNNHPSPANKTHKALVAVLGVLLVGLVLGGSYGSAFYTRKVFLEDFNAMNGHYKQALFQTGKQERENAIQHYDKLVPAYQAFQNKYSYYQPYALCGDTQLPADLQRVAAMLLEVGPLVRHGDLQQAHLGLEKVRPVFQEVFKRNGFSLLAIALVDFHDAMELMLTAAEQKNAALLVSLYPDVSAKLTAIESQLNDSDIKAIRTHLDQLLALASKNELASLEAEAAALKTSFVKVYLQRG